MKRDEFRLVRVNTEAVAQEPIRDDKKTVCAFLPNGLVVCPGGHYRPVVDVCR